MCVLGTGVIGIVVCLKTVSCCVGILSRIDPNVCYFLLSVFVSRGGMGYLYSGIGRG